jgi:hypothetical protein
MSAPVDDAGTPAVEVLRRWERGGAVWRVVSRTDTQVEVALMTCTVAQEMDRLVSSDPEVLEFIGDRDSSDD